MPDYRKPPLHPGSRTDGASLPTDVEFSIESTTMRLASLKLRRAQAADKALDDSSRRHCQVVEAPRAPAPAGRVRHDERGMAVWDWAAAAGDTAALSATNVMRQLEVTGLSIEQTQRSKAIEPLARDAGGGSDPYNQVREAPAGDPFKRNAAAGGNPYDRGTLDTVPSRHPPPKTPANASTARKPGHSLLGQLTGKKR